MNNSEEIAMRKWNSQSDQYNQWDVLDSDEKATLIRGEPLAKCEKCDKPMIFVEASDFRGWSCMDTPFCVFRIPLPNEKSPSVGANE